MVPFSPVQRTRVADQVASAIRQAIVAGRYRPGDRLPPERDLALQFGVNRSSVREALQQLGAWGLVDVRQGGGATVEDFLAGAGLQVLPWLLAPDGEVDSALMQDLLHVRVALLGFTAELAATNASTDDVQQLAAQIDRLEAAREPAAMQTIDFEFFETLIAAGGNRVLGLLASMIGRVYAENAVQFEALYPPEAIDVTLHRATVTAIRDKDPHAARAAMETYGLVAMLIFTESTRTSNGVPAND